jgi:hypothetical protein
VVVVVVVVVFVIFYTTAFTITIPLYPSHP